MNQMERDFRPEGLAEIEYLDGEYRVQCPNRRCRRSLLVRAPDAVQR